MAKPVVVKSDPSPRLRTRGEQLFRSYMAFCAVVFGGIGLLITYKAYEAFGVSFTLLAITFGSNLVLGACAAACMHFVQDYWLSQVHEVSSRKLQDIVDVVWGYRWQDRMEHFGVPLIALALGGLTFFTCTRAMDACAVSKVWSITLYALHALLLLLFAVIGGAAADTWRYSLRAIGKILRDER